MVKKKKPRSLKLVPTDRVLCELELFQAEQAIIKAALIDVLRGLSLLQEHLANLTKQLESLKP